MTFSNLRRPLLFFCCLAALCSRVWTAAPAAADPGANRLAAAGNDFGFQLLHQRTAQHSAETVFFSPFSVSQALLLTLAGAAGQTRIDMAQTLGVGMLSQSQINADNALLLPSLTHSDPEGEVSVANSLWVNQGYSFDPAFQQRCRRFYNAQAAALDFQSPASVQTINGWVSRHTHGKVTQIVTQQDLVGASAVLTNAVYFHGKWQSPFDPSATQDAPFYLPGGRTKNVPLMSQQGFFPSLSTPQFQAVSLPYGTGRMSLDIFLPKPGTSLSALVLSLNSRTSRRWVHAMQPEELTLFLPRFKAHSTERLNAPLSALGMGSAFGSKADFKPMGVGSVFISAVIHKAVLEVDEQGTVAAAATAVVMVPKGVAPPQRIFRVDHPFYCALRDTTTGTILFEGVIGDPQ